MSSPAASPDLKGGRLPAVKVGGMRVVQHKRVTSESDKVEEKPVDSEAKEDAETDVADKDPSTDELAASSYHKTDKDFPKEAVNCYHVKPLPGKEFNAHQKPQHHHIQQPRKEWMLNWNHEADVFLPSADAG